MKVPTRGTLPLVLLAVLVWVNAGQASAQCSAVDDSPARAWYSGDAARGVDTVTIYVDSHGSAISSRFTAALNAAIQDWKASLRPVPAGYEAPRRRRSERSLRSGNDPDGARPGKGRRNPKGARG